jgi:hypothetical protein
MLAGMARDPVDDSFRLKLGKTAVADVTLSDTVVEVGPLPAGQYSLEGTVAAFVVQCRGVIAAPSAALLRAQGTKCPANTEVDFVVEIPDGATVDTNGDGYLKIVQASGAGGGTMRIVDKRRPVTAALA